jgi:hypothetical protein
MALALLYSVWRFLLASAKSGFEDEKKSAPPNKAISDIDETQVRTSEAG